MISSIKVIAKKKKKFLIQFCIKASVATENYKLLQLIIINVIIYHF